MTSTVSALTESSSPIQPASRKSGQGNGSAFASLMARAFAVTGQSLQGKEHPGSSRMSKNLPSTDASILSSASTSTYDNPASTDEETRCSLKMPADCSSEVVYSTCTADEAASQSVPPQTGTPYAEQPMLVLFSDQSETSSPAPATGMPGSQESVAATNPSLTTVASGIETQEPVEAKADSKIPPSNSDNTNNTTEAASQAGDTAQIQSKPEDSLPPAGDGKTAASAKPQDEPAPDTQSADKGQVANTDAGASEGTATGSNRDPGSHDSGSNPGGQHSASPHEQRVDAQRTAAVRSNDAGMSSAQTGNVMKSAVEQNETAAAAGQKLPGVAQLDLVTRRAPTRSGETEVPSQEPMIASAAVSSRTPQSGQPEPGVASTTRQSSVEMVHRAIDSGVVQLKKVDGESLSVVLKPDENTQLTLHLKLRQGQVEALVFLNSGDSSALNAEWSQMQERLAQQGVRLAPLVAVRDQADLSTGQNGRNFNSPERDNEKTVPRFDTSALSNRATSSPRSRVTQTLKPAGWESWA